MKRFFELWLEAMLKIYNQRQLEAEKEAGQMFLFEGKE
jgi:hypothetical protein